MRGKNQSDLLIRFGKAEIVLADLVKKLKEGGDEVKGVYMQKEVRCHLFVRSSPCTASHSCAVLLGGACSHEQDEEAVEGLGNTYHVL